jgi:hypothetical protein
LVGAGAYPEDLAEGFNLCPNRVCYQPKASDLFLSKSSKKFLTKIILHVIIKIDRIRIKF